MDQFASKAEHFIREAGITDELIDKINKKILTPNDRANIIWLLLQKDTSITNWDIICFCISYLAAQVQIFSVFGPAVKNLGQIVFLLHYLHPDQIDPNYQREE